MTPFLQQLATDLLQKHGTRFSDLCIVFPNRRAGLFFKHYVAKLFDKPIFAPKLFSIEDFVIHHTQLVVPDALNLSVELYKAYKKLEIQNAHTFIDFMNWAPTLLTDFNEIDQYLVSGKEIFTYLDKTKAIQKWNLGKKPLTPFEENYLAFYNLLAPLYEGFRDQLLRKKHAYSGLAFRQLVENQTKINFSEYTQIVFAGFNALTPVEEKLFQNLYQQGNAEFYWDGDTYYVDNNLQEAGQFLRKYRDTNIFGTLNGIGNHFSESEKNISIIGVSGNVGQAKLSGEIMEQIKVQQAESADLTNTAVVLVDESLLLPVLNSLPKTISELNITMGFPLKLTPLYSLLLALLQLLENAKRSSNTGSEKYYHKDILKFIQHPFIQEFKNQNIEVLKTFYSLAELQELLGKIHPELTDCIHAELPVLDLILLLIQKIQTQCLEQPENAEKTLKKEYLYHFSLITQRLKDLLAELGEPITIQTIKYLFGVLSGSLRLPFYGEPLRGLQLTSMLETRALDFENLILLSVNDGQLPKGKQTNSFIPFDIRKEFQLPVYSDYNAVFAYHFYRLLQRSRKTWLLYNTNNEGVGSKEPSRFITQLLHEMPQHSQNIKFQKSFLEIATKPIPSGEIRIQKDQAIHKRLVQMAKTGFSPSALGTYLNCRLQFYFRYIAQIQENDEICETADAATIGTVVHDVLEEAYRPFAGKILTAETQKKFAATAQKTIKEIFKKHYQHNDLEQGKNLIVLKVIENMVERFLKTENIFLRNIEVENQFLEIIELEKELENRLQIADLQTGEIMDVKIKGKIDRIDKIGATVRVIDYKTGLIEPSELKCASSLEIFDMKKPAKMLQLLLYAWLYETQNKSEQTNRSLTAGIISLRQSSTYVQNLLIGNGEVLNFQVLNEFEPVLSGLLSEIFDLATQFTQTENTEMCRYCDFNQICNK